jgi:hypothetical protein
MAGSKGKKSAFSPDSQIQVIVAVIMVVGSVVAAYITFLGNRIQVEVPINATRTAQTVQANLVSLSASTPTESATPAPTSTPQSSPTLLPTETVTPSSPPTTPSAFDQASIIEISPPGFGCPARKVMPDYIVPKDGSVEAFEQVYEAYLDWETLNRWPTVPQEDGRFNGDLWLTSLVEDNRWIRLGTTVTAKVTVDADVPEHVDVVIIGQCGEVGTTREFPSVTLASDFADYRVQSTFAEADYFSLEPGEFENFDFDFVCDSPGAYRLSLELPLEMRELFGTATQRAIEELICPQTFTLWDALSFEYLEYVGDFQWNGSGYDRVP